MKLRRIYAIALRHLFLMRRSYDRLSDAFYWITLDLLTWGITGLYFQRLAPDFANLVFTIISGVILWNMVYRSQIDITMGLLEELWNKNLINLFVSPLSFQEWMAGLISVGLFKALLTLTYSTVLVWFLYQVNLMRYGWYLLVLIPLLFMTGWALGFFVCGLILRFGTRVQMFAWTLVWILSPLSAIYFPLDILPGWAQAAAHLVPTSYVFEQMRYVLKAGTLDWSAILIALTLNLVYLTLAGIWLRASFGHTLRKGLVKVY